MMVMNKIVKLIMMLITCLNLLTITACAKEYHLKNHKDIPIYFEDKISSGLKEFIREDLAIALQLNKNIEIVKKKKKYKTIAGTRTKERRFYEMTGPNIFPSKLDGLFYRSEEKKGKAGILVNKKIIGHYKNIYKRKAYYQGLHKEIKEFVAVFNSVGEINLKDMPLPKDMMYLVGFSKKEVSEMNDETKAIENKKKFEEAYKNYHLYVPSMIAIKEGETFMKELKGKMYVETIMEYPDLKMPGLVNFGGIHKGIPLVKDEGKWKLLIVSVP